jgi:hypothetical protein
VATKLQSGRSDAIAQAKPIAAEVLQTLKPVWEASGHPARPAEGHYEVKIASLVRLHALLCNEADLAFARNDGEARAGELRGGRQLFYRRGNVLVRVKTRGTAFRGRPHITVSMVDVRGDADDAWHTWDRERVKFTADGIPAWKNMSDGNSPFPFSFPTRIVDGLTNGDKDIWADDCHFDLPAEFDATGEFTLLPQP